MKRILLNAALLGMGLAIAGGSALAQQKPDVGKLCATIEGSREATAHGTAEMPVWGYEYRVQAAQHHMDTPYDPEVYVRTRILALIDYIYRLQAK
jgi:hypothetical protein